MFKIHFYQSIPGHYNNKGLNEANAPVNILRITHDIFTYMCPTSMYSKRPDRPMSVRQRRSSSWLSVEGSVLSRSAISVALCSSIMFQLLGVLLVHQGVGCECKSTSQEDNGVKADAGGGTIRRGSVRAGGSTVALWLWVTVLSTCQHNGQHWLPIVLPACATELFRGSP